MHARFRRLMLFSCLLLVGAPLLGRAAPATIDTDPDTEVARRHFEDGRAFYERGDYRSALAEFEEARLAKPGPAFDFNIARCHDRLEEWDKAIAEYERYASENPGAAEEAMARERIAVLHSRLEMVQGRRKQEPIETAPHATPAVAPATPAAPTDAAGRSYLAPAIVGGCAVALLAVGGGLAGSVVPDYNRLKISCANGNCPPSDWQSLQARERAGVGLLIAGGIVAAADVVLWVLEARKPKAGPRHAWLVPSIGPGGAAGLVAGGVF